MFGGLRLFLFPNVGLLFQGRREEGFRFVVVRIQGLGLQGFRLRFRVWGLGFRGPGLVYRSVQSIWW